MTTIPDDLRAKPEERRVGAIGNYYGHLTVKREDGRFWWSIEDHDGHWWEEIPESLFDALTDFSKDPA